MLSRVALVACRNPTVGEVTTMDAPQPSMRKPETLATVSTLLPLTPDPASRYCRELKSNAVRCVCALATAASSAACAEAKSSTCTTFSPSRARARQSGGGERRPSSREPSIAARCAEGHAERRVAARCANCRERVIAGHCTNCRDDEYRSAYRSRASCMKLRAVCPVGARRTPSPTLAIRCSRCVPQPAAGVCTPPVVLAGMASWRSEMAISSASRAVSS